MDAAFEIGDAVLDDLGRRVGDAGVDRSELSEGEPVLRLVVVGEDVRGGLVDGQGARARRRVGDLSGVDLAGFE